MVFMGVLEQAEKWIGTTDGEANHVPGLTDRVGLNGSAWCAIYVALMFMDAGTPLPADLPGTFRCDDWARYAYANGQALELTAGQPGDVIIFSWYPWRMENGLPVIRNSGSSWEGWVAGDHVGIITHPFSEGGYHTLEGNTQPGTAGNQSEGDGVYRRWRALSTVCCIWRPPVAEDLFSPAFTEQLMAVPTPTGFQPQIGPDNNPWLTYAHQHPAVAWLNDQLRRLGFTHAPADFYDWATVEGVQQLQMRHGFPSSGEMGPQTWRLLDAVANGKPVPPAPNIPDPAAPKLLSDPMPASPPLPDQMPTIAPPVAPTGLEGLLVVMNTKLDELLALMRAKA